MHEKKLQKKIGEIWDKCKTIKFYKMLIQVNKKVKFLY